MRHHILKPNALTGFISVAAVAAALACAPVPAAAANGNTPPETEAGETVDAFVNWARDKAHALDAKLDEAASQATDAGAEVSDAVKDKWQDTRRAIERQRDAISRQIDELERAAKSEWSDAKEATEQGLSALGQQIEEFRAMIMERKSSGLAPVPGANLSDRLTEADKQQLLRRMREQAGLKTDLPESIVN